MDAPSDRRSPPAESAAAPQVAAAHTLLAEGATPPFRSHERSSNDGRPSAARAHSRRAVPSPTTCIDALPVLLTMNEVASLLRTSRKAIYAMVERDQLRGVVRLGRRLLVRRDDLLCWLDERRAASPGGTRR